MCAWFGHSAFKTSGLRQSAEWRKSYLNAIVRQDVGWYDTSNPAQLSSKISSATMALEDGISSKMANGVRFLGQGVVGIGLCFYHVSSYYNTASKNMLNGTSISTDKVARAALSSPLPD